MSEMTETTGTVRGALVEAARYILRRSQLDPELGYALGPGTEAYRLLTRALALHEGEPHAVIEQRYGLALYGGGEREAVTLRRRIQEIESGGQQEVSDE